MTKNSEKQRREKLKTPYKAHHWLFLMGVMVILMSIPLISAWDFDNTKHVKETKGKAGYKNIEIKNVFGLGSLLWAGSLDTNTDYCGTDCSAIQTIVLHYPGSLVDEVKFERIFDNLFR